MNRLAKKPSSYEMEMAEALASLDETKTGGFLVASESVGAESFAWAMAPPTPTPHTPHTSTGKFQDEAACVVDGLYVGSWNAALDAEGMKRHNVRWVLSCAGSLVDVKRKGELGAQCGVRDHAALVLDDVAAEDMLASLEAALEWIDAARSHSRREDKDDDDDDDDDRPNDAVLVHCVQGVSRSVAVVIAWLMTRRGMTLPAALSHVRSVRPSAQPNEGFLAQLHELERARGDVSAARLAHRESRDQS